MQYESQHMRDRGDGTGIRDFEIAFCDCCPGPEPLEEDEPTAEGEKKEDEPKTEGDEKEDKPKKKKKKKEVRPKAGSGSASGLMEMD